MGEKKHPSAQPLYVPADFYMLRAPALPAETFFRLTASPAGHSPDLCTTDIQKLYEEATGQCYQELRSLSARELIKQAVAIASFSLFDGFQNLRQERVSRKTERIYSRLLRYIVRMCTRPTPFGLFAGVAMGTFADHTEVELAVPVIERTRTRPTVDWLFTLISRLEQAPEVVAQLQVTTNQTSQLRGGRVFLPNTNIYGLSNANDTRALSIRATSPVLYALERASQPVLYADLRRELIESFPRATPEQVDRLLWQLWENHFLLSDLLPPLTHKTPARYVLERLSPLKGVESTTASLQKVIETSEALDRAEAGSSVELLRELARHQEQLVSNSDQQQSQLQIDASLSTKSIRLNREIGTAAAQAAETMLRLSRLARGMSHLQHYLAAFLERYGAEQEVPLLDLLSPEKGLDAPVPYQNPPRTYPFRPFQPEPDYQKLDAALCALVTRAVNDRSIEIELTDDLISQLEQWSPKVEEAPPSLDIYLLIQARSQEALDRGEWRAIVAPNFGAPAGGRTFGRFFELLDQQGVEALHQFTRREEALFPDKIFAELSYLPASAHIANVITQPGLRTYEIPVGTTPSVPRERVIHPHDLVVGVRHNRFYVRSLRLGKEVIACQSHMLNSQFAPNVCRFLLDLAYSSFVGLSPFNWGLAANLPFLPRVVQGKIVLRPAQWNLTASTIRLADEKGASEDIRWFLGLQRWRSEWRVPRYVYLTYMDNRLLLDLEHPGMAKELQMELAKATDSNPLSLVEVLPDFEHLWLKDSTGATYFSEIVVPLLRADALADKPEKSSPAPQDRVPARSRVISQQERSFFPAESWTYLKLYSAYKQHDELITGPLREFVKSLLRQDRIDCWFYIRYCDSAPHLRLRLHTHSSQASQELLAEALAWSRQLVEREQISHFSLDTYEREVERYGGPAAIEIVEQFFAADSVTASDLVAAHYNRHVTVDPHAIAVFSLDSFFAGWGLDLTERLQWLRQNTRKYEAGKAFHAKRQLLCDLVAPWEHTRNPDLMQQRELLCQLITPRQSMLPIVSTRIREIEKAGELWTPIEHMLGSLAHMHINRFLGVNRPREQYIYALWRQTLESVRLRPQHRQ
jgi:thiopeptide-type bacteriocin biosynthesis protein